MGGLQDYTRAHFARRTVFDPFPRRGGGVAGVASGVEIPENPVLPEEARAARGTKGGVRGFRIWNGHSRMGRRRAGPRGSAGAELPPVLRRAGGSWLRVAAKIGRLGGERRRRGRALRAQERTRIYTTDGALPGGCRAVEWTLFSRLCSRHPVVRCSEWGGNPGVLKQ